MKARGSGGRPGQGMRVRWWNEPATGARAREIGGIEENRQEHVRRETHERQYYLDGGRRRSQGGALSVSLCRASQWTARSLGHRLPGGSLSPPTARSTSSSQWRLECPYVGRLWREARGRLWGTEGQWNQIAGGVIDGGSVGIPDALRA